MTVMMLALALLAGDSTRVWKIPLTPTESLSVESRGTGPAVVLVPGLFGSAYGFRQVVPLLLAAGYRTIVIEPLGFGHSSRPPNADYSLLAQADRVATAIDSLGLTQALMVAHSLGGAIAMRVAYRRPELVGGLVLLESGPTERATTPSFRRAMRFVPLIKVFGGMHLIRRKIRHSLINSSGNADWVTDSVVAGYTAGAAMNLDRSLKAFLAMSRAEEREPLFPHLRQIACPVRLLIGTAPHDGFVPAEEVQLMDRTVARFNVDSIVGAGHFIHEERPDAVMTGVRQVQEMSTLENPSRKTL